MTRHLLTAIAAAALTAGAACSSHKTADADTPKADTITSVQFAREMGLGWNYGNAMDSHKNGVAAEDGWGNVVATRALFDSVAAAGFTFVRIPVTWLGHIGEAPDYTIDPEWLARVDTLVSWAEAAGLKAVVNIHHDGADSRNWLNIKEAAADSSADVRVRDELGRVWKQIAGHFADKGDFLVFEAFNEIHDGGWGWGENTRDGGRQYAVLNGWLQTFVDSVRAAGGANATRFLGIPGYCTNPKLTMENLVLPDDTVSDRLLVAVHFYDPYEFAIGAKVSDWGHTADPDKKLNYGDEANVTEVFDALKAKFIDAGHGLYIGEWGCGNRDTDRAEAFRRYYLEYVTRAAADRDIAITYWDNGYNTTGNEAFGLFDRTTGAFYSDRARAAVKAMTDGYDASDTTRTLQTIYNNAPIFPTSN